MLKSTRLILMQDAGERSPKYIVKIAKIPHKYQCLNKKIEE